ncbi:MULTISPECIES: hypothetical protein [unclassified Pseudonocardia]|uniref:hypothetical protein n=1 Tax=unclassified Pseudonocardia TaxID=2619320 RepID=UPI000960C6E8|nr:hypothetical protein [Pseudonocardia sp. Ae707_Ps1]OLM08987.1 hypothetical protein Ae707Ps1_5934 [Pseudonocardia sp. Ae707_Ps1]
MGARAEQVSQLHAEMAERVIDAVRAVEDPAARHRLIGEVLAENSGFVAELAGLIRESVRAMKDEHGLSYGQIATELGLSRSRAQQLYNGT